MGIRKINALFARAQQQLTVNGPPLHRPIILSALRIPRISSRTCLCFLHLSPPSQPPGKPGPCLDSRHSVLESVVLSGEQARRRCPTLRLRASGSCGKFCNTQPASLTRLSGLLPDGIRGAVINLTYLPASFRLGSATPATESLLLTGLLRADLERGDICSSQCC